MPVENLVETSTDRSKKHLDFQDTIYAYRMCWIDKKGNKGPYSLPSECTVTV